MGSTLVLALLAGVFVGALFSVIQIPIPAPPSLPGVLGIIGIFLGYKGVEWVGVKIDLLAMLSAVF
ncbi:XapX domain-containing protein [Natronolimnobius sp. AArcel1]|uniref:XapX domain-containing protein n=1 Tax=Natronolimnobius sp. AArcel1 TaxID=1679093 RepID=UPI0013ED1BB6|nr:XapX domain-containing protein [Natronolimnobius sp. AArcel1]NGM70457.1 XapX domain-containing protein [Natronolimnobius sp. AArcel1]